MAFVLGLCLPTGALSNNFIPRMLLFHLIFHLVPNSLPAIVLYLHNFPAQLVLLPVDWFGWYLGCGGLHFWGLFMEVPQCKSLGYSFVSMVMLSPVPQWVKNSVLEYIFYLSLHTLGLLEVSIAPCCSCGLPATAVFNPTCVIQVLFKFCIKIVSPQVTHLECLLLKEVCNTGSAALVGKALVKAFSTCWRLHNSPIKATPVWFRITMQQNPQF